MAAGEADCPTCLGIWTGTVKGLLSNIYVVPVSRNRTYLSELSLHDGDADLEVLGRAATNVKCEKGVDYKICTFDARLNGEVELEVIGTQENADYVLYFEQKE